MITPRVAKRTPMLSLVPTADIDASVQRRASYGDELRTTLKGVDNRNDQLRLENAYLRAMLTIALGELTGAQKREKHSRHLAFHDDLTALPNRRFFLERLACALSNQDSRPPDLSVIYLDL